jgi:peptidase YpeB-like protein
MKRAKIFATVIYAMLVMGTIAFVHFPDLQADEATAKIGAEQAQAAALRAVPGTVHESDLETKHGRLVYSFEIVPVMRHGSFEIHRSGQRGWFAGGRPLGGMVEVKVSAMDGSIVGVHHEHAGRTQKMEQSENVSSEPERDVL